MNPRWLMAPEERVTVVTNGFSSCSLLVRLDHYFWQGLLPAGTDVQIGSLIVSRSDTFEVRAIENYSEHIKVSVFPVRIV